MWIFKNLICETNQKALWSISQRWVGVQAHGCDHRRPRPKFWYAAFQKYTVPPHLRLAHFLLNTFNCSALRSRTFFKVVICHDPLCTAAWRQESPGSYAIGEHFTDTFLAFAKLSFLCKWKSSEKEMEEELTLLCSIEAQKWQDEEERKQKDHSCKETTKGSILQAKSFCWRCWVLLLISATTESAQQQGQKWVFTEL